MSAAFAGRRVLVCGGRDFSDSRLVATVLGDLHEKQPIRCIIQGAATGVDMLAAAWAMGRGITVISFPANWRYLGLSAEPRRNADMLDLAYPDLVVAFPGGKGTANMLELALARGVSILRVKEPV